MSTGATYGHGCLTKWLRSGKRYALAGTLLPLALAHRWGRIWPAWTGPLRGRAVPRWLVLGPGLFIGASLTAYFGIAGMTALDPR